MNKNRETTVRAKRSWEKTRKLIWKNRVLYLMLLPAVVSLIIFCYVPMPGVMIAWKDYSVKKGVFGSPWVGWGNFVEFLHSHDFWSATKNTLVISLLKLAFCFPAPILFALLLNELESPLYKKVIQFFTFLPNFISWVIIIYILRAIFTPYGGLFNSIRNALGMKSIFVMGLKESFYPLVVGSDIWKSVGWSSIIYIAALAGVDQELYEAATVDGANRLQRAWHISIPGILPTIILLFIMNMGDLLSVSYEQILLLQQPANLELSVTLQTYTLETGLKYGRFEYATAIGIVTALFGLICTVVTNKISKTVSEISLW
ncbi:MAG: ABC transporter permease subunit [Roseburia sp.]|nr:ABC transporter permease subunit [Roseburia sp.]MCM1098173.1 ABC transporter permease subunit [Ruminococcus flavefaciens]